MTSYVITMHPGARVEQAVARLARYIVDRWMPSNAGGVHLVLTPQLCQSLLPLWQAVNQQGKTKSFRVSIRGNKPFIEEVP